MPAPENAAPRDADQDVEIDSTEGGRPRSKNRTHTPRPDELSRETFEFISAVDEYKRRHMRSFLEDREVLDVLRSLGYSRSDATALDVEVAEYSEARRRYRVEQGRLFPTWSEVFELFVDLGYRRRASGNAA